MVYKIFFTFILVILVGCQSSNQNFLNLVNKNLKNISKMEEKEFDKTSSNPLSSFFENFKPTPIENESILVGRSDPNFKVFNQKNAFYNVLQAVKSHPSVLSAQANTRAAKLTIETLKSGKDTQVNAQALSGVNRDNSKNSFGAIGSLNISKLLFDYGSLDNSILSQKKRYQVSRIQAKISAETVAIRSYEVWVNLNRQKEVVAIYKKGLEQAEPFLGQIENISVSGLGDTSMFIKAQQDYAKLKIANSRSQTDYHSAVVLFNEMFPGGDVLSIDSLQARTIIGKASAKSKMLKESPLIKAQDFLIQGLEAEYKALKAQQKPNVAMNAGLTAPARDTAEDSTANIGILVNYVFNDGGRLENQIATLKEQIKEAKRQRQSIEKQLISQLDVALESYYGSEKSYKVIFDMVELSQKNKEELSAQLQTGRSKIQDVLNAEVTLAENRILLVNALAEFTLASYRVRALTHGLTKEIGWKAF